MSHPSLSHITGPLAHLCNAPTASTLGTSHQVHAIAQHVTILVIAIKQSSPLFQPIIYSLVVWYWQSYLSIIYALFNYCFCLNYIFDVKQVQELQGPLCKAGIGPFAFIFSFFVSISCNSKFHVASAV